MSMYTITLDLDGRYHCSGMLQDGTEYWIEDDLEKAIKSMKQFAEVLNHHKGLKKKEIKFLRVVPVKEPQYTYEEWKP